ncbi:MAG: MFS transporter [Spirochaetota bacterium]
MQTKGKMFYGWWIAIATFFILFVGLCSGFYTVSVFLKPFQDTFGWTSTQISLGFTIAALLVGLLSPVVGIAVDKLGVKKVQLAGALITGTGLLLASMISQLWHYYLIYVYMAIGLASVSLVPAQTIISYWFDRKRGTAMGLIMTGVGLGGMVMVYVASFVTENYGWENAYRFLGTLVLVLVVPLVLFVLKNKPEDVGFLPDGAAVAGGGAEAGDTLKSLNVKEAFKTLSFKFTCLLMFLFSIVLGGLTMHAIELIRSYGVSNASTMWSLALGFSVLGRIFFGLLSDRMSKKLLVFITWVLLFLGFGSVMFVAGNQLLVWGFVVFYGLAIGSFVTLIPLFVGDLFGVEHFSKLIGIIGLMQVIGLSVGSVLFGKIYDANQSYELAVMIVIGVALAGALVTVLISKPER